MAETQTNGNEYSLQEEFKTQFGDLYVTSGTNGISGAGIVKTSNSQFSIATPGVDYLTDNTTLKKIQSYTVNNEVEQVSIELPNPIYRNFSIDIEFPEETYDETKVNSNFRIYLYGKTPYSYTTADYAHLSNFTISYIIPQDQTLTKDNLGVRWATFLFDRYGRWINGKWINRTSINSSTNQRAERNAIVSQGSQATVFDLPFWDAGHLKNSNNDPLPIGKINFWCFREENGGNVSIPLPIGTVITVYAN